MINFNYLFLFVIFINSINGQQTTTPAESAIDNGKQGNPGAQLRFSSKALDEIYSHAIKKISDTIRSMSIPDIVLPVGPGMLTVKGTRITDVDLPQYERQFQPPNRIQTQIIGGRIASLGQWQYQQFRGSKSIASGIFRMNVANARINMTNQLSRTRDAKPIVQTNECKADLSQFRVEIEGFGDNSTVIDHCDNMLCQRIRSFFENSVCEMAKNYVKEIINRRLSTFPTRINLYHDNRFVLDYCLMNGEPKVTDQRIQANLKGDVVSSRGSSNNQFYANDLTIIDDNDQTISFSLSDYVFNTLFNQAHNQQYRFSVNDLLSNTSNSKESLRLNCSSSIDHRSKPIRPIMSKSSIPFCLGSLFDNITTIGPYPQDVYGDLLFKTQRPLQFIVRQPPQKSQFSTYAASIEIYGPTTSADGKRDLLARTNIDKLVGEFSPKMAQSNITAAVNMIDIELSQPQQRSPRIRSLSESSLEKLKQLSTLVLIESFNTFLNRYAQFPIPLVDGYECSNTEFQIIHRTMQIDCKVRIAQDAMRNGKSKN